MGPLAKHLDDLVLTYSVLKSDEGVFSRYSQVSVGKKYRILVLRNFFEPFNVTLDNFGATFFYYLDDFVNKSMQNAMENMRNVGFELVEARLNASHFSEMILNVVQILEAQFSTCAPCFFAVDLNLFFKNSGPNVAFHSLAEFLASPLLSQFWKGFFSGGFDLNGDCIPECAAYDGAIRVFKRDFVRKWFDSYGVDVAVLPTMVNLPERIDEVDETRAGAMFIASYSGFAALNLPVAFSEETLEMPDGLPVGLAVLAPPEKIEDAFAIAKIYSEKFVRVKITPKNIDLVLNASDRDPINFKLLFGMLTLIFFSKSSKF